MHKVDQSNISMAIAPKYTSEYIDYIFSILKTLIKKNNLSINFVIGDANDNFNNQNQIIRIDVNTEHTLVKKGGRGAPKNSPFGTVKYDKGKNYLARLKNYNDEHPSIKLINSDIIIDYSMPNIQNIQSSGHYDDLLNKHIYISPCLYKGVHTSNNNRSISSLTTFLNIDQGINKGMTRRRKILKDACSNMNHVNMTGLYSHTDVKKLYQNTKVLINIHQTDHHHTFEELRCLPALQNGALVVAEKSPLNHLIPYNDLIIWADYKDIVATSKKVLDNYEKYHTAIFTKKNINTLNNLHAINIKTIECKILKLISS